MGFGLAGWKSAVQSAAQTIAQLVNGDIVAKSISLTQAAASVAVQLVTGARLKLGGGTTDYLTSDGATTISAAGAFTTGAGLNVGTNAVFGGFVQAGSTFFGNNATAFQGEGQVADGGTAIGVKLGNFTALTVAGAKALAVYSDNFSTLVFGADKDGRVLQPTAGNSTGAAGSATLNTASGRSAIASGAAAATITNSLVSATSQVYVSLQTADATLTFVKSVVPGAGSFVVTGNANATANTNFCWFVVN